MRRSIYLVCAAMCFIPSVLMAQQTASAPAKSSQADKAGDSIQRVLKSKSPDDFRYAVEQLVGKASKKQLREYKNHSHNSIALHAAWEQVKRSTTITRAQQLELDDEDADLIIRMDKVALLRFISFLEGRLRVTPPNWWRARVRRAQVYWGYDSNLYFPRIDSWFLMDKRMVPYLNYKDQVHALSELDLTPLADGSLKVTSGKLSCTIPARYLKAAKKEYAPNSNTDDDSWMDLAGLTAWMDAEHCIFGFQGWMPDGFTLHCIDRKTSKPIWSTKVRGYGYIGQFGGGAAFWNWVEIRRRGDTLYLFGVEKMWGRFSIEAHSMKDGTNLFHFTTYYRADPRKEEE